MNTDLTEEEMRRALFGSPAPAPKVTAPASLTSVPSIALAQAVKPQPKKKTTKAYTPRLRVTMHVTNEFEGEAYELIHEADTLSTLLAEQEAVKTAKKKYRYVEVISVSSM
ncbi:hypothetical protein ALO95_200345 [Pseudomonas syringae pv. antirrhini]|uniref:Uncharacterized protein n=1 Tax=Pseudomonas syringae pv. antirrhini TaxID=251702 RepID=A0A0P9LG07_9PSED|nr:MULTISPECIES: hypothetical protein [Pseudomonas]KPW52728.1 Uncharacterized protein ALO88_00038 [Pseudomonas syringae pv. antirrhini]RMP32129.1 hypothetical protein ALQ24_03149 [Pseudomonas syringae pv. antirrhini]RMP42488.1 hypothetical protein ALQ23_200330 [Pseudomonas syringae pv. antirrhini]RMW23550.1 hypothetical protein ALO95_200345 [Pseudomonas syringae pv. antirrhini]WIN08810.1 hypothetical protein QQF68_08200 [Pseudomonas syringae pv. antirrhini str. 126]